MRSARFKLALAALFGALLMLVACGGNASGSSGSRSGASGASDTAISSV